MDEPWKTILMSPVLASFLTASGTVTGGFIIATFAYRTAKSVTAELERQKLKAAEALEIKRLESQRNSELQKQRMELYRALYLERIQAAKRISETSGVLLKACAIHGGESPDTDALWKAREEFALVAMSYDWLFGESVRAAAKMLSHLASGPLTRNPEHGEYGISTAEEAWMGVHRALEKAMQSDDLEKIFKVSAPEV